MGNLFELEDLGAKDLKGITGRVKAWASVTRPTSNRASAKAAPKNL